MFLQCPFSFYIYTRLGLEEERELEPNLMWGDAFHVGLEHLIPTGDVNNAVKEAVAYLKKEYPQAPPSFSHSIRRMLWLYSSPPGKWETEQVFNEVVDVYGKAVRLKGKKDGIGEHEEYGPCLIEHKCKGYIDPILCGEEIKEDLQCNIYMKMSGVETVIYDLLKIPVTQKYGPDKKYDETVEEYVRRLYCGPISSYNGKYPINSNKGEWIHQGVYRIYEDEQEDYWNRTVLPILDRICEWWEHVTQPGFDHENPKFYNHLFYKMPIRHFSGRKTDNFKCPYHAYLTGQEELTDLVPVSSYFSELNEQKV